MLEITLSNIIETLKQRNNLKKFQVKQLELQIKHWQKDTIIYPGMFKSKLFISIESAYDILEFLVSQKILERNYEIYCNNCSKFKGIILRNASEFKSEMYCDFCNKKLVPFDDSIVIYRVIIDD